MARFEVSGGHLVLLDTDVQRSGLLHTRVLCFIAMRPVLAGRVAQPATQNVSSWDAFAFSGGPDEKDRSNCLRPSHPAL